MAKSNVAILGLLEQAIGEHFSHWWPITLMPIIYKLLAKIIANHIKYHLFSGLIEEQNGFITHICK